MTSTPSGMKKERMIPSPKESTAMLRTFRRFRLHIRTPVSVAYGRFAICYAGGGKNMRGLLLQIDEKHADVGRVHTADAGGLPDACRAQGGKLFGRLDAQAADGAVVDVLG